MSIANKLIMAASNIGGEVPEGVSFDGVNDFLDGQSFTGANLEFDIYYVSGTMPFGIPVTPKNTWTHVTASGSYTVEDIGLNFKGRLANITLDASVDMPMRDADTAHINKGTGGDFIPNGTLDTAQRGPNQDNCVASEFDGIDDRLSLGGLTIPASNKFVASFIINRTTTNAADRPIIELHSDPTDVLFINWRSNDTISFKAEEGATAVFEGQYDDVELGVNYHIAISYDGDTGDSYIFCNGADVSIGSISTSNTSTAIDFTDVTNCDVFSNAGFGFLDGSLGELYFDTNYVDLSTENPFWDADNNLPKPVLQVLEETGSTPLIAMPLSADDPEENYGAGGNFTLNGGGLAGARGGSEYWSRSCVVDGTNYLTGSVYCESLVRWLSTDGGTTWNVFYENAQTVTNIGNGTNNGVVSYYLGFSDNINWALEENKSFVTSQLGFPKLMDRAIRESGFTPVLGLDFSDIDDLGYNKYGADFTVAGTPAAGADVNV